MVARIFSLIAFSCSWIATFAQAELSDDQRPVKAFLTLTPSKSLATSSNLFYLHGNLEKFITPNISLAGDGFYSLGTLGSADPKFEFSHSGFFGANFHRRKNAHDFYFGFQPGLSIAKLKGVDMQTGVNPVVSFPIGYNFFVSRIFHFFLQGRIVLGEHHQDMPASISEFRFSAGLGFNYWR